MVCRVIRPWIHVRFGYFTADRIGHFAFDLEYYLSERYYLGDKNKFVDLFFLMRKPANSQLALMAGRQLRINALVEFLFRANQLLPGKGMFEVLPSRMISASRDKKGVFDRTPVQLSFTEEEQARGYEYLKKIGCNDLKKVVCLVVRDAAYLDSLQIERDWSYHSFRDTRIEDYEDVVSALVDRGYWVFRMGKRVNSRIGITHSQVTDYACSSDRCDFLDVWLMANSFFSVSTGLGLDSVSDIFRRPQVFVNYLPLMDMEAWGRYITVPKILSWSDTGKPLTLAEQMSHSSVNSFHYKESGISIRDLTPTEITDAVLELEARLAGKWNVDEDEVRLHKRFWASMKAHPDFSKYHGWIHPDARVGSEYLREAQTYLFT
jgi:putative glycosyltransferase (TIGR04372 family)